jgi:hypothetical protein
MRDFERNSNLVQQAFSKLFPNKPFNFDASIDYSGKFKGYNSNAKMNFRNSTIVFGLSKNWRRVDNEIKIGLLQDLMQRMFKQKSRNTLNIELYNKFMQSIALTAPKTKNHPTLEESYLRVNQKYFLGIVDQPNLTLADSVSKLGSYDFGTDTITISRILLPPSNANAELLDYVMYHELLHKKLKFSSRQTGLKKRHHTSEFRQKERQFENAAELEMGLSNLVSRQSRSRRRKLFFGLF